MRPQGRIPPFFEDQLKTLLTDLTGVRFGLELKAFQALTASFPDGYEQAVLLCQDQQKIRVPNDWQKLMRSVPDYLHFRQIARLIGVDYVRPAVASPEASLVVATFHNAVLDIGRSLTADGLARIRFVRWQGLFLSSKPAVIDKAAAGRALASLMTPEDALRAIECALKRASALDSISGLPLAKLRPFLEVEEPRFKKTSDAAKVLGIVGANGELAEQRGLIVADRAAGPHFKIWLKSGGGGWRQEA